MTVRLAVFASGGGTNLQALLDHFNEGGGARARVDLVVSDRADAGALERARAKDVATHVVAVGGRSANEVTRETLAVLTGRAIDAVVLAGYLRLVPGEVVRHYRGRMVNIHPALLPAFGGKGLYGLRVHRAVLEAGCTVSGATVHFVDEEYDTGRILAQWPVPVLAGDTPEALAARVLEVEHRLFPAVVELLARVLDQGADPADLALAGYRITPATGGARSPAFRLTMNSTAAEPELRLALGLE